MSNFLFGKKEGALAESVLTAIIILHMFCPQINLRNYLNTCRPMLNIFFYICIYISHLTFLLLFNKTNYMRGIKKFSSCILISWLYVLISHSLRNQDMQHTSFVHVKCHSVKSMRCQSRVYSENLRFLVTDCESLTSLSPYVV